MGHIFLSYSRKDLSTVRKIVAVLRKAGYEIWIDEEKLVGGAVWQAELANAIAAADACLVALSPESANSESVHRELWLARDAHRKIIPIEIRETQIPAEIKFPLAGIQRIQFGADINDGISRLLDALKQIVGPPAIAWPAQTAKTEAPDRLLKDQPAAKKKRPLKPATGFDPVSFERAGLRARVVSAIKPAVGDVASDRFYFWDDMPVKLQNALTSYAKDVSFLDALMLFDNTVMGGAKEGMVLTPTHLYWSNLLEAPKSLAYRDIKTIKCTEADSWGVARLIINKEIFNVTVINPTEVAVALKRAILAAKNSSAETG